MSSVRRITLYDGEAPFARPDDRAREVALDIYLPDGGVERDSHALIALPGGAYSFLSPKSGRDYGRWFSERGLTVFAPAFRLGSEGYDFRAMCTDALRTLALARELAPELGYRPDRVGYIGTSAGAHLAAVLATGAGRAQLAEHGVDRHVELDMAPEFCVLCYGVLSLMAPLGHDETRRNFLGAHHDDAAWRRAFSPIEAVGASTPRSFVWHTAEDTEVPPENSMRYVERLVGAGRPVEFHLYQKGAHALGLAREQGLHWAEDCARWIKNREDGAAA
ncbi:MULTISPECIES: alpha/beta hydrolase [Burkholderia]|uniref:alpha/beta hydrolase n=1 Tax=Burkholderia TaxID=32008 RepID=UPI00119BFF07|nr:MULTISPECIES: alpha/beta hydrolase [Burkholderia]MDN7735393.1 alpha/beta hydrolase [Burkholderia gladioli]TWC78138.1 acetyl esterase/lipase [Burkholderia sp. SJZ089]TWD09184.1 acetyl esterase/lipase [Burkholderia sp. SJZ115]TWD12319.1 acetyl esterase/lipase [Burkholderia sp. SJZ091]